MGAVQRFSERDRKPPRLDDMLAEGRDESVVRPGAFGFDRRIASQEGGSGGIKHCVLGPIAGIVGKPRVQQQTRCAQGGV